MVSTEEILINAKRVSGYEPLSTEVKNSAIANMVRALLSATKDILLENAKDVESARGTVSEVMLDRLSLNEQRINSMAEGMLKVAQLNDPVGRVLQGTTHSNGMSILKTTVPFGVVAIIYESRPNVTSDAAVLAFKSGNACILRGGKEAYRSSKAIVNALRRGLQESGLDENYISLIDDTTRESANKLMTAVGFVDLLIPRGGKGLIKACCDNAKVPCIETGTGICHIYVDASADFEMALNIIDNSKTSRPSVCNAAEVCLVSKEIAAEFLPLLYNRLSDSNRENRVEFIGDSSVREIIKATQSVEDSFDTEFLDYKMAIKIVDNVEAAVSHISKHSTHHSEAIITNCQQNADYFVKMLDSAAIYVNASTRFTDGGEFGLGCEMGISTQKLHVRGPMGLEELTTYKYVIKGNGQIR